MTIEYYTPQSYLTVGELKERLKDVPNGTVVAFKNLEDCYIEATQTEIVKDKNDESHFAITADYRYDN